MKRWKDRPGTWSIPFLVGTCLVLVPLGLPSVLANPPSLQNTPDIPKQPSPASPFEAENPHLAITLMRSIMRWQGPLSMLIWGMRTPSGPISIPFAVRMRRDGGKVGRRRDSLPVYGTSTTAH